MIDHAFGVQLGAIEKKDLERIRSWRNEYAVFRWCRQNDLISDAQQEAWFERIQQDSSIKMYRIQVEDQPVGVCGLTSLDWPNRRAEFSLYIAPQFQKRGYGRQALQTLFTHGFKTLGLNCIWGESMDDNPAIAMFESLGMKREGVRRDFYFREGRHWDAYLFSVLSAEWMERLSSRQKSTEPFIYSGMGGSH
jgi:UDP-4-amino-4,6-dideoxy-N-acetyl-beta-L-altrosamine N-acetyltransferase